MFTRVAASVAALCLAGGAAAQETAAPEIWETMSVEQTRVLAAEIGAVVDSLEDQEDGGFVMALTDADGMPFALRGTECRGVGEAKTCSTFDMFTHFETEGADDAAAMADRIDVIWVAAIAVDDLMGVIRRMTLEGGVTREHVGRMLVIFLDAVWAAHEQAFPRDAPGSAAG